MNLGTLIKRSRAALLAITIAAFTLAPVGVMAHDGGEDVTGTVLSVTGDTVTVKTTKGKNVDVKLDAKTEYTRGKAQAKQSDLLPGMRVVVHAMEMNKVLTAHLVQLQTSAKGTNKK